MELERLGKYELLERLGQGGMGEVWKGRDTQLRRYVAIKLLHADLQANPDFVTHFMREAQFVASLRHPNIVPVHDFQLSSTEGSKAKAYMVMDYVEGGTLADYIRNTVRKGLFPPAADIVYLFTATGLALDYAHQKGMIHRDIKPANILLDKPGIGKAIGEPFLTDFGIARLQGTSTSTVTRALIGTPLYISPEQAEDHAVDEHSDLYSLGIVLYEIVTGITPFRGDNPIAIMMQHLHEKPTPPALINPHISPALSAVVLRSIAKDPKERFPTAAAMSEALAQALNVAVPTKLNRTGSINGQPDYNPLQPTGPVPGMTPHPPVLTASPPATFTPASPGIYGSYGDRSPQSPLLPLPQEQQAQPAQPARHPLPPHFRRKWLLVAAIACILLGVVGISTFPLLFPKNVTTTPTTSAVVGHIVFHSSPNAPSNTFDQLQIDLEGIPAAPNSTAYYAWLGNSNNEVAAFPHWQVQVSNGAVHGLYSSSPQHTDLLAHSDWFLVTAEPANSTPVIPFPDPSKHFYYALISHTASSSPTFEVRQCPGSNTVSPCR
ncbi:MAG: serine/threonine protein kinase [Chloroflexi bacterium]|nr:MAG: serine/threonine protein kinase [Chloroflexota bacterium]